MARLFGRRCKVLVGSVSLGNAIIVSGLRTAFKVERSLSKEPNTLDLSITNLSLQHRSMLQTKGIVVTVQAGYDYEVGNLFTGDARTVEHVREGANWVTRIKCGDGETAYANTHVSETFGAGSSVVDVVTSIANKMGLGLGNLTEKLSTATAPITSFTNGYTAHGKAARELERLLEPLGYSYSIQDGSLLILGDRDVARGTAVALLNKNTGLIGSPQHGTPEKKGGPATAKVRCLLRPVLKPGSFVQIEAESMRGPFKIRKLTHLGDTAAGDWYTDLEVAPL